MTLRELGTGRRAVIRAVGGSGALRQHFLDMGVIPGTQVEVIRFAPLGDPMELRIHGYELTLRLADAEEIEVEEVLSEAYDPCAACASAGACGKAGSQMAAEEDPGRPENWMEHPGLGEGGRFHDSKTAIEPDGSLLTFALVGNQNSGKTTLFNRLTGSNQHVGNFPGVTVDRKDGSIVGYPNTRITDLPGIYSMSPYSSEELVSRDFVLKEKPKAIINIVDATNIERNLYLTMQLLEMERPMVLALNMMDEMSGNGGSVDINRMEAMLGIPVIPISAAKNQGIDELVAHAVHIAEYQEAPEYRDLCSEKDGSGAVQRCMRVVSQLVEDHARKAGIPARFAVSKLIEGDRQVEEQLKLDPEEKTMLEQIVSQMEKKCGMDRSAAIADMRYGFIEKVARATVTKPHVSREHERSQALDRILTGKYTAIPVFIGIMSLIFWLTFNVIGAALQGVLENLITLLTEAVDRGLTAMQVSETLHSLIIDGIFEGVGSVLSFVPIIVTLFFFLSLLEDSGYIARVAFFMDKALRRIGLSGRSIVPMLIGFGCTVPAVMATRTLPSERDRKMTILLTPFMSCSAKLPIYAFFVNAFFPGRGGWIMSGLYVLGIVMAILVALLYKKVLFRGEAVPFVMELPNYRMPSPLSVARLLREKAGDFLERAFTVIFLATIIVWFLQRFDLRLNPVADSKDSILALLAGALSPLFRPIGLGDWRICTSLISGFMAKESVVSTLKVLFESSGGIAAALTPAAAASLLVFSLLYTPCVAAVASVRRELGARWAAGVVFWQCIVAWAAAWITYTIALTL